MYDVHSGVLRYNAFAFYKGQSVYVGVILKYKYQRVSLIFIHSFKNKFFILSIAYYTTCLEDQLLWEMVGMILTEL